MVHDQKNVIVVSLQKDTKEISLLIESLEYSIIEKFVQIRKKPDSSSYIGLGKLSEIKKFIEESSCQIDIAVFNGNLKPSQWFYLEKELKIEVIDRIRLILNIFKDRAKRKEAKLQVKLAELEYEKPYVKELIHRARSGEHPGLMAGGEYQVDDYYEMIKKQMRLVKQNLKKIQHDREIQRQHRYVSGYYLISLAGYTNAGKSSLLQILTEEQVTIEDRLFSTLSTLTRKMKDQQIPILITDTVGFIQSLPAWIINAFHSTLEEIQYSDLVLLVIDGSESLSIFQQKLETSLQELSDLKVTSPIIIVVNKIDLVEENQLENKISFLKNHFQFSGNVIAVISVKNKQGIMELIEMVYCKLPNLISIEMKLPNSNEVQSFISWLHDKTNIIKSTYKDDIYIHIECNQKLYSKIISMCIKNHGNIIKN